MFREVEVKGKIFLILALTFLLLFGYSGFARKNNKVTKPENQRKFLQELEIVNTEKGEYVCARKCETGQKPLIC